MFKAAQTEVQVLKLLGASDPDNYKHCIRLLRFFEYRNHFCLVFEAMVRRGGRGGPPDETYSCPSLGLVSRVSASRPPDSLEASRNHSTQPLPSLDEDPLSPLLPHSCRR